MEPALTSKEICIIFANALANLLELKEGIVVQVDLPNRIENPFKFCVYRAEKTIIIDRIHETDDVNNKPEIGQKVWVHDNPKIAKTMQALDDLLNGDKK